MFLCLAAWPASARLAYTCVQQHVSVQVWFFKFWKSRIFKFIIKKEAIRCFNRREDQRKKKEIWPRDQETIISGIVGKNREWLIYNEEKNTMHCQWCMDYAADSDKKSVISLFK